MDYGSSQPRGPALNSNRVEVTQYADGIPLNSIGPPLPLQQSRIDPGSHMPHMPRDADAQLWSRFISASKERSGVLTSRELQRVLYKMEGTVFDHESIRLLMSKFNVDNSGTLTFDEFAILCDYINQWRAVFRYFDADMSGSIEFYELQNTLRSYNCDLMPQTIAMVVQKYTPPSDSGRSQIPGSVGFVEFMMVCVAVKALTEKYHSDPILGPIADHSTRMNYDQFIQTSLRFI